jgi:polysaccharide chain length determinant protein (PEP-CTERM system associated)
MSSTVPTYSPEALLKVARRRKWQIIVPAIVIAAAVAVWAHRLPNRYRSDTVLVFLPQRFPETFVRSTVTTRADDGLQSITQQILSRTQLEQIIFDFHLYSNRRKTIALEDIVDTMRARDIEIQPLKRDAFRLGFIADNPEAAMLVTARLASLFVDQTSRDRTTLADGADQFLEAQLEDARRKLVDNEARLDEYRRRHNGELPSQLDANVQGLHAAEMRAQALADSLNHDREKRLAVERSLKDASVADSVDAGTPTRLLAPSAETKLTAKDQLERAEAALKELQSTLTAQHPDILALKQRVTELQTRASTEKTRHEESGETGAAETRQRSRMEELRAELREVEGQIAQKTAEEERVRALLLNYQRRIEVEPAREGELAALTRDYDTLQGTYRALLAKKQESEIAANLERRQIGAQFKVLDPAQLRERPFAPNRARLDTIGALVGIGIGVIFAVILEWCDRGLRTPDDVRAALGLTVLASIPSASLRRQTN